MSDQTQDEIVAKLNMKLDEMDRDIAALDMARKELEEERDEIGAALTVLYRHFGGGPQDLYKGRTKLEAVALCLKEHGKPMGTAKIVDTLLEGGFETASNRKTFYNAMYAKLREAVDRGELVKTDRKWALPEQVAEEPQQAGLPVGGELS